MIPHYVTFINTTALPINIETWQYCFFGFSEMKLQLVNPGEKIFMVSETGEWLLNTHFYDKDIREKWLSAEYKEDLGKIIGKFTDQPYKKKGFSWMYTNIFEIVYANGVAVFQKKNCD
jgi:hypothetical protein